VDGRLDGDTGGQPRERDPISNVHVAYYELNVCRSRRCSKTRDFTRYPICITTE
jgi:hypothetical protein